MYRDAWETTQPAVYGDKSFLAPGFQKLKQLWVELCLVQNLVGPVTGHFLSSYINWACVGVYILPATLKHV